MRYVVDSSVMQDKLRGHRGRRATETAILSMNTARNATPSVVSPFIVFSNVALALVLSQEMSQGPDWSGATALPVGRSIGGAGRRQKAPILAG